MEPNQPMPYPMPFMVQQQPKPQEEHIPIPIPIFLAFKYLKYCRDIQDPTVDRVCDSEFESRIEKVPGEKLDPNEASVKARCLEMLGDYFRLALEFGADDEEKEEESPPASPTPASPSIKVSQEVLDLLKKVE